MSTDRELLELAAKAAGIEINSARQAERDVEGFADFGLWTMTATNWNPLTDDGDALRLMVHLSIFPVILHDKTGVLSGYELKRNSWAPIVEKFSDDHYATMRRAIVRAAAEIGRAVQ